MKKLFPYLLLICLLLSGCASQETEQEVPELLTPAGVRIDKQAAYIGDFGKLVTYNAYVRPETEKLSFEVGGVIDAVNVIAGQAVQKGDVLVTLNTEDLQEAYEADKKAYDHAVQSNDYNNRLALADIDLLKLELDELRAQGADETQIELKELDIRQAELTYRQGLERQAVDLAERETEMAALAEQMSKNEIIAPFDGHIVFGRDLQKGDSVAAYETLLYLADDTRLYIEGDYIAPYSLKSAYSVCARIGTTEYAIEARPDDQEELMSVMLSGGEKVTRFDFTDADISAVESGDYAAIIVEVNHIDDALLIPTNAIFTDSAGKFVYVYTDEDTREKRYITTGAYTSWETQVKDGLEEGEIVYVAS